MERLEGWVDAVLCVGRDEQITLEVDRHSIAVDGVLLLFLLGKLLLLGLGLGFKHVRGVRGRAFELPP